MAETPGVQAINFFWSSHDNAPTRRSYLMNELKNNYRDLDFSTLQTKESQFSRIKAKVISAKSKKAKIKGVVDAGLVPVMKSVLLAAMTLVRTPG